MGCLHSKQNRLDLDDLDFDDDGRGRASSDGRSWGRRQITTAAAKLVVVDVGGGSINVYLNNKKKAAPSYVDEEYEKWKGGDASPLSELIKLHVGKVLLNESSSKAKIKIGITGSARKDLTPDEIRSRIEELRAELEAEPPVGKWVYH